MVLADCATGLLRLFFVLIKFGIDHIGWAITFVIALWLLLWFFQKFGVGYFQSVIILFVIFLVFFFATAWYTGAPLCQFADEVSLMFV